ncbi:helix-turn-helix transcriptional regulator [Halalkalibacterium halodurans]|uniref:helix-turn-helix domain-containing protein n=1 Tax=Halalkalibacterium halodurans TaxID=86665 RepID=UPI002E1CDB62|nr:helix-turn-helix transcriptional regulator [Halalkalibacterium halodurans]MED4105538.1 helix-turn-helix transcriptional regulator [Halalkalibacterium halodurans]MED4109256.1 helix-turn-helix transcriptional regulator [Halalkalibacterium halodurans]MED4149730.1 helix-turn-helix transcriptional regulator [Halalkalibacterium halodurans]
MERKLVTKLSELMGKHKIRSIKALSEETGISRITLTKLYEGKSTRFDAHTIKTLCDYFNCSINDLIDLEYVDEE